MYGCGFLILEQTAIVQNRQKTTLLFALVGCKQVLLRARGRAGRAFRTCGVAWERFWRVAFVCGSQLVKERETSLLISKIVCWLLRVRSKELHLRRFGHS